MSIWGQFMLQDANSLVMESMIFFYDMSMLILIAIILLITYMLNFMLNNKFYNNKLLHGQMIEIIWTLIPMVMLSFLAMPSLKILYLTDEILNSFFSLKIMGHQWYWSYEYNDMNNMIFDSYMSSYLNLDTFRLLDVDNRVILPFNVSVRLLISSSDVIHSFALPSMGIKIDAVPGRINQILVNINRPGLYFGQCSEICGVNHSFMPIVFEVVDINNFMNWMENFDQLK